MPEPTTPTSKKPKIGAGKIGMYISRTAPPSAEESAYRTPTYLLDRLRKDVFGGPIGLDPCTAPDNPTKAQKFYCLPQDGRMLPWDVDPIYVNPPFGTTMPDWLFRCRQAANQKLRVVLLAPLRDSRWCHDALPSADDVLMFTRGLRFNDGKSRAPFSSLLLGWNVSFEYIKQLGIRLKVL